jgi:divinyl chlorophyllide a 8-vinyl-reductase
MAAEHGLNPGRGRRILLAGATGYIGRHVLHELQRRRHHVTALVRRANHGLDADDVRLVDLLDEDRICAQLEDEAFAGVVSCIASRTGVRDDAWAVDYQANLNLLKAGIRAGAGHFVLLSAICVQRPRLAFQQAKLAFEKKLAESGLDFSIVRPTAFFKSLAGQIERVRAGKPYLMFGDGRLTACKPIAEQDLAEFIVDCLSDEQRRNRILPIGGPGEAITPREQGEMLFELTGKPPRFTKIPPGLLKFVAAALAPPGVWIPALRDKSEYARIGHYYATESMLVWNNESGRYDAAATPSTGTLTLRQFYEQAID